jgi:hypothetical protein
MMMRVLKKNLNNFCVAMVMVKKDEETKTFFDGFQPKKETLNWAHLVNSYYYCFDNSQLSKLVSSKFIVWVIHIPPRFCMSLKLKILSDYEIKNFRSSKKFFSGKIVSLPRGKGGGCMLLRIVSRGCALS